MKKASGRRKLSIRTSREGEEYQQRIEASLITTKISGSPAKEAYKVIAMSHHTALTEDCTDFSQPSEHPDQNKNPSGVSEAADLTGDVLIPKTCSGRGGGSSVCSLDEVSRPSFLP